MPTVLSKMLFMHLVSLCYINHPFRFHQLIDIRLDFGTSESEIDLIRSKPPKDTFEIIIQYGLDIIPASMLNISIFLVK